MAKAARKKKTTKQDLAAEIVDEAVRLGEAVGWGNVKLHDVAENLNITLPELRGHFRDLDAIANAFFTRALDAMLARPNRRFAVMPPRDRIEALMLAWFDYLAPHRILAVQMLQAKMWPYHPHHWVPMVFDLSRLIQWLRDAAGLNAGGRRKQIEEIGLTSLFLATLTVWSRDESPKQEKTRLFLARRLDDADRVMAQLFRSPGA